MLCRVGHGASGIARRVECHLGAVDVFRANRVVFGGRTGALRVTPRVQRVRVAASGCIVVVRVGTKLGETNLFLQKKIRLNDIGAEL